MIAFPPGTAATEFIWAGGIEDTFVPQTRPNMRALDEYELLGHYEHWREDLALAKASGMQAIRWGVPWYRVEPEQGVFDWSWTDEAIPYIVNELRITPIIDLMHYGCPLWLKQEFVNPAYPEAVATYAAAFAARYGHLVRWYTPLNEPLINAMMCGRRGLWPPYLRGDRGYVRVMMQLASGIFRTVEAIRAIQPDAVMVHVDAASMNHAEQEALAALAHEERYQNFLCYDLLTGRVTPDHRLFGWLARNGASARTLAEFADAPLTIDIMGLNFYPQWSTRQLYFDRKGRLSSRIVDKEGEGFGSLIESYYQRYGAPVMVTETSHFGSDREREAWLDTSLAAIKRLREQGTPVIGYTWFPLFTMVDWRYRFGRAPVEKYYLELGLYRLNGEGERWQATPLASHFRTYTEATEAAVGRIAPQRARARRNAAQQERARVQVV